jgi:predicted Zn-dependent protease
MADKPGIAMGGAAMAAKVALDLPNSRTAEREADEIGMQLAVLAGYDPDAAVSLWDKMAAQGGANPPQFLSTHPAPGNRQQTLAAMIPAMRQLNPTGKLAAVHKVEIVR